ncbi:MAG: ferritin-like domain-containing protein [Phycisphaerae bacterium]
MKIGSLKELLAHELADLYSAENQLVEALPKMVEATKNAELKDAFEVHFDETIQHVARLEKVFEILDISPHGHKCKGMEGLLKEGKELLKADIEDHVLDAALIGAAQRVEHYEIAGYGVARTFAERLGNSAAASILQSTLDEEGATNKKLTSIAQRVNVEAQKITT